MKREKNIMEKYCAYISQLYRWVLLTTHHSLPPARSVYGFTLIETLVAISVLVVAISAPLSLASQSLFAAYYAKDQVTAFYLAQEGVELVRNRRDNNMLKDVGGVAVPGWLDGIPQNTYFVVDGPNNRFDVSVCGTTHTSCPYVLYDGDFYNHTYGNPARFKRSVYVAPDTTNPDEALITATVSWRTGSFRERTFTLKERIYNWVP